MDATRRVYEGECKSASMENVTDLVSEAERAKICAATEITYPRV